MRRQCVGLATAVLVTGGLGLAGLGAATDAHARVGPFADYPCASFDPFCHGDGHGDDGRDGWGHGGGEHGGGEHGGGEHGGGEHGGGEHGG